MSSNVAPAGPKRRTLAEFGRQLQIGDGFERHDKPDGLIWRVQQVWRTDRLVHLTPENGGGVGHMTVRFAKLRDNWRRVV